MSHQKPAVSLWTAYAHHPDPTFPRLTFGLVAATDQAQAVRLAEATYGQHAMPRGYSINARPTPR